MKCKSRKKAKPEQLWEEKKLTRAVINRPLLRNVNLPLPARACMKTSSSTHLKLKVNAQAQGALIALHCSPRQQSLFSRQFSLLFILCAREKLGDFVVASVFGYELSRAHASQLSRRPWRAGFRHSSPSLLPRPEKALLSGQFAAERRHVEEASSSGPLRSLQKKRVGKVSCKGGLDLIKFESLGSLHLYSIVAFAENAGICHGMITSWRLHFCQLKDPKTLIGRSSAQLFYTVVSFFVLKEVLILLVTRFLVQNA